MTSTHASAAINASRTFRRVEITDILNIYGCTVNPTEFFYDEEFLNTPIQSPKNILVIGGGIAGMEAAVTACDRGHHVTLVKRPISLAVC